MKRRLPHRLFTSWMALALSAAVCLAAVAATLDEEAGLRAVADQHFEAGRFDAALAAYDAPARAGDKFAQFRVSLIHYFGLAGERDPVEAYAWATVAQEEGLDSLRQYATLISRELGAQHRRAALETFDSYESLYGAVPEGTSRNDYRLECTGSRVGAGCDRVGRSGDRDGRGRFSQREIPPFRYDEAFIRRFNDRYAEQVYADFDRFDRPAATP